jgi:hypothetical protein
VIVERLMVGAGAESVPEEMRNLLDKLGEWSKANPVKGREAIEGEAKVVQ